MLVVIMRTLFLIKQKQAGSQRWPMLSFNDLVTAQEHLLPHTQLTAVGRAGIITSAIIFGDRSRNLMPDGLGWLCNESDKVGDRLGV